MSNYEAIFNAAIRRGKPTECWDEEVGAWLPVYAHVNGGFIVTHRERGDRTLVASEPIRYRVIDN